MTNGKGVWYGVRPEIKNGYSGVNVELYVESTISEEK